MSIKKVVCTECGVKNEIHFCVSKTSNDEFIAINHNGYKILDDGSIGKKVKNIKDYDLMFCQCLGKCSDEISEESVKLKLSDNSTIVGGLNVWNYIKNNIESK